MIEYYVLERFPRVITSLPSVAVTFAGTNPMNWSPPVRAADHCSRTNQGSPSTFSLSPRILSPNRTLLRPHRRTALWTLVHYTNQIFYFEDSFNKSTNNSLKLTNVQSVAINANSTKVENEDESELFRVKSLEEWYHFYANEYNSKVNNNVNSNNLAAGYETMAVSPIPGVPASAFTTLGASKDLSNDAYSYYKRTYIYPINPDLFITTIMKISFVHNKSNFPSGVELANGTVDLL